MSCRRAVRTTATMGSNAVDLQVAADEQAAAPSYRSTGQPGKGAAGQAVQNANLVLGLERPPALALGIACERHGRARSRCRCRRGTQVERRVRRGPRSTTVPRMPPPMCSPGPVKAAPVIWSRRAVGDGVIGAVVLNAGGAMLARRATWIPTARGHVADRLGTSPPTWRCARPG